MPLRSFSIAAASPKPLMHDIGAFAGKGAGDGQADARGRAGDEGDFAFEHDIISVKAAGKAWHQPRACWMGDKAAVAVRVCQTNCRESAMIRAMDTKPIHPHHPSGHRYAPVARPERCGRIALVLQGGGALGAYQGGRLPGAA